MFGPIEIECPTCNGDGEVWNNADVTSRQCVTCPDCAGEGWREATDEEASDMAADAWSDLCSSEPPISWHEQAQMHERAARRGWGAL